LIAGPLLIFAIAVKILSAVFPIPCCQRADCTANIPTHPVRLCLVLHVHTTVKALGDLAEEQNMHSCFVLCGAGS
jgi:hypothetical protein